MSYHFRTTDFGPEPTHPPRPPRNWGRAGKLLKLATVCAALAGGVMLFQSPVFAVEAVHVEGLEHRSEGEVLNRLDLLGRNVLTIPVAQVQQTLTEDPWLRHVDVQRQLPNRITLRIEERRPVAIWEAKGGRLLMAADGTLLDPAPANSGLPVVRDIDGPARSVGERLETDAAGLAAKLVAALPAALGQSARSFEYMNNGGLVVETDKGRRARFGDSSDFEYKLAVWKALLAKGEAAQLKVGHVDLRFGDRPFFREN